LRPQPAKGAGERFASGGPPPPEAAARAARGEPQIAGEQYLGGYSVYPVSGPRGSWCDAGVRWTGSRCFGWQPFSVRSCCALCAGSRAG